MKGESQRATSVTRANHGVDNNRIGAHASLAGMGDFNCRAEIDLSPRGGLSCARTTTFHPHFFYLAGRPPSYPLVLPHETRASERCVFTLRKHLSLLLRHVARKAAEIEYEIRSPRAKSSSVLLCRSNVFTSSFFFFFFDRAFCRYFVRRSLKIVREAG